MLFRYIISIRIKTNRKHDFALTTCVLVMIFQKIQPLKLPILCWKRGYKCGLMAYNASNNGLFAKIVIYSNSESEFENLKVSRIFHLGAKNFFPKICAAYVFLG